MCGIVINKSGEGRDFIFIWRILNSFLYHLREVVFQYSEGCSWRSRPIHVYSLYWFWKFVVFIFELDAKFGMLYSFMRGMHAEVIAVLDGLRSCWPFCDIGLVANSYFPFWVWHPRCEIIYDVVTARMSAAGKTKRPLPQGGEYRLPPGLASCSQQRRQRQLL